MIRNRSVQGKRVLAGTDELPCHPLRKDIPVMPEPISAQAKMDRSPEEQLLIRPVLLKAWPSVRRNIGHTEARRLRTARFVVEERGESTRPPGASVSCHVQQQERKCFEKHSSFCPDIIMSGRCYSPTERLKSTCQWYF